MTTSAQAVASEPPGLWDQVHRWLGWVRLGVFVGGGLFLLILVLEIGRVYTLASGVHPLLGYATAGLLLAALAVLCLPVYRFLRMPPVVQPPPIPALADMKLAHLVAEVRYLERYLANCSRNPRFAARSGDIDRARHELGEFGARLGAATQPQVAELNVELGRWVERTMPGLLAEVDEQVDRMIYQEALAVGVGTAVSPNGTLDAFVMLWRSLGLASKIAESYYGRPGIWGTLAVCRDVSVATAVAGTLHNVTDSLGNILARTVGGITSVVAGPAVEGATNALVLIRIGYLTKERCRSFRRWDQQARASALMAALSSTRKVAVGLTSEIFRQVGSGLGSVASAAVGLGQKVGNKISSVWRGKKEEEGPEPATE